MKILKYDNVSIDKLEIGLSQARTRDVKKNLGDLKNSIEKVGLLMPILVAELEEGNYEVIAGQRRFLACKELSHKTISAGILDQRPDAHMSKAISAIENMVREDMVSKDLIDVCTELHKKYGSVKAVSDELGLPYNKVTKYIKFDQLISPLKERFESGELKMDAALRAQQAATNNDGDIDEILAVTLADEMKGMAGVQQKKLARVAKEMEGSNIEDIVEKGRKQAKVKEIVVVLSEKNDNALEHFAAEEETNKNEAAANLIVEGLGDKGYGSSDE